MMKNFSVTTIGEILYDVYPEAKRLGGAPFNFTYHIWKILGQVNFISSVGSDANGREILSHLNSIGFNTKHVYIDKKHPTGTVQVKLGADKTPQFTISPECSYDYIKLNASSMQFVENKTELLYFGTLSQRSAVTRSTIQFLFGKQTLKYFCDLNLRHDFFSKELIEKSLHVSNVIKVNKHELEKLKRLFSLNEKDGSAVKQLMNKYNIDLFCVTHGEGGAELFNSEEMSFYKVDLKNPVDTLGAGDAYAAILCLGYLKKMPLTKINKLANEFAAEICMVPGALPQDDSLYTKYKNIFDED